MKELTKILFFMINIKTAKYILRISAIHCVKVLVFEIFLVCIFLNGRDTEYLSVFILNAGKCGPEKLFHTVFVVIQMILMITIRIIHTITNSILIIIWKNLILINI